MINYLTKLIDDGYEVECSTKVLKDVPLLVLSVHKRVYLSESRYVKRGFTRTCIPISLLKATSESVRDRYVLNCLNAIIEQCNRECILLSDGDSHFNNWTPDDYNKYLGEEARQMLIHTDTLVPFLYRLIIVNGKKELKFVGKEFITRLI